MAHVLIMTQYCMMVEWKMIQGYNLQYIVIVLCNKEMLLSATGNHLSFPSTIGIKWQQLILYFFWR